MSATHASSDDADDLRMMASLLLEDLGQVEALRKDKRREDALPTDEEVATELFAEELRLMLEMQDNRRMARELAAVVDMELAPVEGLKQLDNTPSSAMARRIPVAGGSGELHSSSSKAPDNHSHPPSVSCAASTLEQSVAKASPCAICTDLTEESDLLLPCSHTYHVACAVELFEAATKDESLLPLRCCGIPIPVELVTPHLSATSAASFLDKLREHETSNRLYCPKASCSQFIGSVRLEQANVQCPKCSTLVCARCKLFAHPHNVACVQDTDPQPVLDLAQSKGWKRCPGCSHMVELRLGCYHMTCLCRTEFCYLCAVRWKNCSCKRWDEERLVVEHGVGGNQRI